MRCGLVIPAMLAALPLWAGCASDTGRVASDKAEVLYKLEADLSAGEDYDLRWQAATACLDVVEDPKTSSGQKLDYARRALKHAELAVKLEPERVEGHYYRAVSLGRVMENQTLPDFRDGMRKLEKWATRARKLDPTFSCGGPLRFLALLYQNAPEILMVLENAGDEEVIEELYQEALRLVPHCTENYLYYAEFLRDEDRSEEALELARKAETLLPGDPTLDAWERKRFAVRIQALIEALKS